MFFFFFRGKSAKKVKENSEKWESEGDARERKYYYQLKKISRVAFGQGNTSAPFGPFSTFVMLFSLFYPYLIFIFTNLPFIVYLITIGISNCLLNPIMKYCLSNSSVLAIGE